MTAKIHGRPDDTEVVNQSLMLSGLEGVLFFEMTKISFEGGQFVVNAGIYISIASR